MINLIFNFFIYSFVFLSGVFVFLNYFFKNNNPKGYKKINEVETKRTSEINRDGYSKKKYLMI